jgi:phosphoribosyl 1,2-cyclic phosphodiesterase
MTIKIWGCRGSIPSPGGDTSKYGGNTTCVEVRLADGSLIVIDAGSGIRSLGLELVRAGGPKRFHLFLTHAHWDHLQGFPFFLPAYLKDFSIQVWGGPRSLKALRSFLQHQMAPPYFPVKYSALQGRIRFPGRPASQRTIAGTRIQAIPLSHPNGGYGFKFTAGSRSLVYLTDNELGFPHRGGLPWASYAELCRGVDLVLHDAQYTEEEYRLTRGWGHSTFAAAAGLCLDSAPRRFGLIHHDPKHTDLELDACVKDCRRRIARGHGRSDCFGATEGMEISL